MQSSNFFEKFPSLEERKPSTANKCVIQFFEGEFEFHVRKEPQIDPKIVGKKTSFGSCSTN